MGPIWGRQDPGGPHVGPMNFAIWGIKTISFLLRTQPHNIFIVIVLLVMNINNEIQTIYIDSL